jgi:hypothetical protein
MCCHAREIAAVERRSHAELSCRSDAGLGDFEPALADTFCALCRKDLVAGLSGLVDGLKACPLAHVAPDFRLFRIGTLLFEAVSHGIALTRWRLAIKGLLAFRMNPNHNQSGDINVYKQEATIPG